MSGGDVVCHVTHVPTGGDVWGDAVCRVTHVPTGGDVWGRCSVSCHSCAYRG